MKIRVALAIVSLALVVATVSLACGWLGMRHLGGAGAVLGIVVGEAINLAGVLTLCLREVFGAGAHRAESLATAASPAGTGA